MCARGAYKRRNTRRMSERELSRGAEKAFDSRSSPAKRPTHAPEDAETVYARTRHIKRK